MYLFMTFDACVLNFYDLFPWESIYSWILYEEDYLNVYIYNGIIFPSLNNAKTFDLIPDEHSHKVVRQLVKSHVQ